MQTPAYPYRAVITGHSKGIGAALAQICLLQGWQVLGLARSPAQWPAPAPVGSFRQLALDLADSDDVTEWLDSGELAGFLAGAHKAVLINNAGVVDPMGPPGAQGTQEVARAVALNVAAPLMLTDAWVAATVGVTDRRVAHIGSGAGRSAYPGWSVYGATKAALDQHARAVQLDALPGLRIESLAPGVVDTDMQAHIRATPAERFHLVERFISLKSGGQLTTPMAVAEQLWQHLGSNRFGVEPVTDLRTLAAEAKNS